MIINLDNVNKKYNGFELNCTLEVKEGCITGLVGANGAGKSTTFQAILGLIDIDGGKIELFDKNIKEISAKDKEKIGVVLGTTGFPECLTVKNIISILKNMYHDFDKEQFAGRCSQYNLPLNKPIKDFSTGMKTRLNIITALSHNASLLVLDEPTAGLDVVARDSILDMLREYMETEGRSIIISSHIASDLEGFCDDLYMIHKGSIIFHQSMDTVLEEYGVIKVTQEQYDRIDRGHILYRLKRPFGYECLTDEKQYYIDNFRDIVVEKTGIDDILLIIEKGERL